MEYVLSYKLFIVSLFCLKVMLIFNGGATHGRGRAAAPPEMKKKKIIIYINLTKVKVCPTSNFKNVYLSLFPKKVFILYLIFTSK